MDRGGTGTSGRGSLAGAFLACLRCSAAAALLASHVIRAFVSGGAPVGPVLSGLLPGVLPLDVQKFPEAGCVEVVQLPGVVSQSA